MQVRYFCLTVGERQSFNFFPVGHELIFFFKKTRERGDHFFPRRHNVISFPVTSEANLLISYAVGEACSH